MPKHTDAHEYIIYRQSAKALTILRQMVGGQYVRVATATNDRDAALIRKAFIDQQPYTQ